MSMEERESAQPPPPGHQSESAVYRPCVESANPGAAVDGLEVRSSSQCGAVREMDDSELVGVAPAPVPECTVGKRKRGRPAKGQAKAPAKKTKDEEDVCFICFDGGDLVLCDRRGCPKAYHPACIKRDDAFFRSRAQWSCGWHICSCCEKAAHYMCYTCTYSLCKVCVKESEILCVRENKGFCTTCMGTIMLIENNMQGDKEMVKIDFDDKSSWEYLFKVYWIYTKGKQSLTLDELNNAKNPWKGDFLSCNGKCPGELSDASNCKGSTPNGSGNVVGSASKRRKMVKQPMLLNKDGQNVVRTSADGDTSLCEGIAWASNELLEFVAHVKGGDTSILSVVDVQALLLKYIKNNNLRDPHQKSQVICDSRLSKLFEKTRVGHIEMLKLLESHFWIREDSRLDCMKGGPLGAVTSQMGTDLNNANQLKINRDKRCKLHKKGNNKAKQINLDEYAAIDVHNISLIYLRRRLMENLIGDAEKFSDKVVGAFVRIRPGSDQKQDMYRLVQVVGTHKAAAPYKVGQRFTDVLIEVLNLNKREYISIEAASNQDFSEDECRHLRESIRCGLAKCLTVGEIQKKAIALHEVKLTEWLKSEILRVSHLRDRASEKGHRKELRECVEKLQLLSSPEEHKRRLDEIPEVHADPSMSSCNESEEPRESDKKADMSETPRNSGFRCKEKEPVSPCEGSDTLKGTNGWSDQAVLGSGSSAVPALETLTSTVTPGIASSVNFIETDKIWHYKDPFGKIQGPFRMVELRKWNTTGYFPPDLRIWRSEDDSILLTDALDGQYNRGKPLLNGSYFQSQEVRSASGDRDDNQERKREGINMTLSDGKQGKSTVWDFPTTHFNDDSEFLRGEHCSRSSSWDTPADVATSNEEPAGSVSQGCNNALEGNHSWFKQRPVEKLIPSSTLSGDPCSTVLQQGRESHDGQAQKPDQDHENESSHDHEYSVQSSGQNWKSSLACSSPNGWDTNSNLTKSSETAVQPCDVDVPKFPSPTPKPDGVSSKESSKPVQESGPSWSTASSLGCGNGPQHPDIAGEWDGYSPTQTTPAVEEWEDSHLVSATLLKLSEAAGGHDGTAQDINNGHSIASHDAPDASNWQAVVSGPSEFTPVAEKSVSDLLAETMDDLHSPSIMNSDGEFMTGCKTDCFGSIEVLSPTLDQGKGDALSSTGDLELGYQPNILDEPQRSSHAELFHAEKGSSGQSTATANVEGETKSNGVPMNQCETGLGVKVPPLANRTISDNPARDSELGVRSETMDTSWGDGNLGWGGTAQKNNNVGWGPVSGTAGQGYPNVNRGTSAGYPGSWGSQPKHSGERFYVSRDRGFQNRDLGSFRRGGHSWNKQSSFGGGSPRLPRGQRVCKFHESGRCKKGAFCDYLHP